MPESPYQDRRDRLEDAVEALTEAAHALERAQFEPLRVRYPEVDWDKMDGLRSGAAGRARGQVARIAEALGHKDADVADAVPRNPEHPAWALVEEARQALWKARGLIQMGDMPMWEDTLLVGALGIIGELSEVFRTRREL